MLSMLYALAEAGSDREVWWLHGARNSSEHVFAAEARALMTRLTNGRSRVYFSAPLSNDTLGQDYTDRGRLDADALRSLPVPHDAEAYICGPERFMSDLRAALHVIGLDTARIRTEIFGAGPSMTPGIAAAPVVRPHPPAGDRGDGPSVSFARSGLTVSWRDEYSSVLDLAEACDVPTRWSCRTGVCHTCESGLLAGVVRYDPPPVDRPAKGNGRVCCAAPDTDVVIDL